MHLLTGTVRTYPWGSRTAIAELRGLHTPSPRPEAELWFGSHPGGSSTVGDTPLVDIIAADPESALGSRVCAQYDGRLPFLLKILAAAEPLSLQAHPSLEQAREGCAREDAAGIPRNANNRNYRDDNHKPELIVALTDFEALAGFRPLSETIRLFDAISCPELARYLTMLDSDPEHEETNLRALFTTWITIPAATRVSLIEKVTGCIREAIQREDTEPWIVDVLRNILALDERYPGDVGVLGALLLNKINLNPGEAVFLDAGQLHAYVSGMGVEIMANSDNVLRGGLTSKHVDVPELVRVLTFRALQDPLVESEVTGEATRYPVPTEEFDLTRYNLRPGSSTVVEHDGPVIVLCTAGEAVAGHGIDDEPLVLTPGSALWIPASDSAVTVSTSDGTELFVAKA
ncbi:mannose-6-phosphate isomerase, class I [Corynebacterium sp. CCM 9185]|uniref:mannose-6-phosphate isomerase n=1 Tax=Corynebacterium marambiense TaxID=2765364 RepID=A0ABS0VXZ2_9CORY|nr:mannose-6-phosphate isomerase, class I [Corynebacterium marambiense]MBI9001664.1 mannose-6-phosphate isomerase, class I [Corynebacterium marambiense]MCK7662129.1 mannose-6-phosphate isomerase, class I [Corynebacterium marambiense]MCX7541398.1 mannose-6-phosphate isomerase, class I [Corynebacterium marambiense]